jgi:hypothetical protein
MGLKLSKIEIGLIAGGILCMFLIVLAGCTQPAPAGQSPSSLKNYTIDDVLVHNSPGDCWVALNGSVYDFTQMIANEINQPNPNGLSFSSYCGTDATSAFGNRAPIGSDGTFPRRDFNSVRPDFNGSLDFNSQRDFNNRPRDFNGSGQRMQGQGFSQYLIGKLV